MNIVFLDIDGVLNSTPYFKAIKGKHGHTEIDESRLPLLKRIVEENDAQIVLSASWRDLDDRESATAYEKWQYLVDSLRKYGMEIISKTPFTGEPRPLEIKAWLESRDNNSDIKWISLDDDYDERDYEAYGLSGHLVHTKFFTGDINEGGLQEKHVALARELFEKQY